MDGEEAYVKIASSWVITWADQDIVLFQSVLIMDEQVCGLRLSATAPLTGWKKGNLFVTALCFILLSSLTAQCTVDDILSVSELHREREMSFCHVLAVHVVSHPTRYLN